MRVCEFCHGASDRREFFDRTRIDGPSPKARAAFRSLRRRTPNWVRGSMARWHSSFDSSAICPDTPLRLETAVKIAFPDGGMTVSGLRRERDRGNLRVEKVAGKEFTTLRNIEEMGKMARQAKGVRLWLEPEELDRDGRVVRRATWVIRDGSCKIRTGCAASERETRAHIEWPTRRPRFARRRS
jgi:hypothetical protein